MLLQTGCNAVNAVSSLALTAFSHQLPQLAFKTFLSKLYKYTVSHACHA